MDKFLSIAVQDTVSASSTTTAANSAAADLIDGGATFQTDGVAVGDIVHNTADDAYHVVATVVSETQLTFDSGSVGNSKAYTVYSATASTNRLIGMANLALVDQTDTTNTDMYYTSASTSADVVNISHQAVGALAVTMRTAVEDAIKDAKSSKWVNSTEQVVLPSGIKVTSVSIS
jgi:hypothetical protein